MHKAVPRMDVTVCIQREICIAFGSVLSVRNVEYRDFLYMEVAMYSIYSIGNILDHGFLSALVRFP